MPRADRFLATIRCPQRVALQRVKWQVRLVAETGLRAGRVGAVHTLDIGAGTDVEIAIDGIADPAATRAAEEFADLVARHLGGVRLEYLP